MISSCYRDVLLDCIFISISSAMTFALRTRMLTTFVIAECANLT